MYLTSEQMNQVISLLIKENDEDYGEGWERKGYPFHVSAVSSLSFALTQLRPKWVWWKAPDQTAEQEVDLEKVWSVAMVAFREAISPFVLVDGHLPGDFSDTLNAWYDVCLEAVEQGQVLTGDLAIPAAILDAMHKVIDGDLNDVLAAFSIVTFALGKAPVDIYNWTIPEIDRPKGPVQLELDLSPSTQKVVYTEPKLILDDLGGVGFIVPPTEDKTFKDRIFPV